MKKLTTFFAALLFWASGISAFAQFSPLRITPAISGVPTTVFIVPAISVTNLPAALKVAAPIGPNGFGLTLNHAGTNSIATTNTTITLEFSGDGVNYATNVVYTVVCNPVGVQYAPFYTNFPTSINNIGNLGFVRVKSIQNTNVSSLFITNLTISTR